MVSYSKGAWSLEGWVVLESTYCTECLIARPPLLSSCSPTLFFAFLSSSFLHFFRLKFSDCPHDLPQPISLLSLLVLLLSNFWLASLPSERTKIDLCSGHHKTATILGYGWRELKPHHKDNIVPSPENSHKWDKYCCLFFFTVSSWTCICVGLWMIFARSHRSSWLRKDLCE